MNGLSVGIYPQVKFCLKYGEPGKQRGSFMFQALGSPEALTPANARIDGNGDFRIDGNGDFRVFNP